MYIEGLCPKVEQPGWTSTTAAGETYLTLSEEQRQEVFQAAPESIRTAISSRHQQTNPNKMDGSAVLEMDFNSDILLDFTAYYDWDADNFLKGVMGCRFFAYQCATFSSETRVQLDCCPRESLRTRQKQV